MSVSLAAVFAACRVPDATVFQEEYADEPLVVWVAPDSVPVGGVSGAYARGCPPGIVECLFRVRGLRWTVSDSSIAQLAPPIARSNAEVRLIGQRPGTVSVTATSRSGRTYTAELHVVP